jgi:hypothetical protein
LVGWLQIIYTLGRKSRLQQTFAIDDKRHHIMFAALRQSRSYVKLDVPRSGLEEASERFDGCQDEMLGAELWICQEL